MVILDTSVLYAAKVRRHPQREPCRRVVVAIESGAINASTTVEVIQELCHLLAASRGRRKAVGSTRESVDFLSPLIETSESELRAGLRIFEANREIGSFDAVLAAIAMARSAQALVSLDRGFRSVPGLPYVDPAGPELDALLRS